MRWKKVIKVEMFSGIKVVQDVRKVDKKRNKTCPTVEQNRALILAKVRAALQISKVNFPYDKVEPDEIWCNVNTGLVLECLLEATENAKIIGVKSVSSTYLNEDKRVTLLPYSGVVEAFSLCSKSKKLHESVMFWNVT